MLYCSVCNQKNHLN